MVNTVGTFNVLRLAAGLMAENEPDEDNQRGGQINSLSFKTPSDLYKLQITLSVHMIVIRGMGAYCFSKHLFDDKSK